MSKSKKTLSKLLAVCLCFSCIGSIPVSATNKDDYSLQNSSFEEPVITDIYKQLPDGSIPNWNTTAAEDKIEIFKANLGTYIEKFQLNPKAGNQAAELNADEQSSLYQNVKTVPGSFLKWGISHHGRSGYDTMLLVIGPKQSNNPDKPSKDGYDQFMKMGQYIHNNSEFASLIPATSGASKEFVLYSPKFAAKGSFINGENAAFTTYKSAVNTEEWHIWFIKSYNDKWYDYGTNKTTNTEELDYNNIYKVPENQTDTMFAFTAYQSAPRSDGKVNLTYGNMIDAINFGILYDVSFHTLAGGSGKITAENTNDLAVSYTSDNFNSAKYQANTKIKLTATPDVSNSYIFVGAMINGTLNDYTTFDANADKTEFTKSITVDEAKHIQLLFAKKGHMAYDPNGGTFKGTSDITVQKYDFYSDVVAENELPNHDSAAFTGWTLYTNTNDEHNGLIIPANHTIKYDVYTHDENNEINPLLTIAWDNDGNANSVDLSAREEDAILLVANYNFKHEAIALTNGGSVNIENTSKVYAVNGDDEYKYTAGEEGDVIVVTATPASGYQFDGWYIDQDGEPISRALEYSYVVTGNSTIYAKFSKSTQEDHHVDIDFKSNYAYIYGHNEATMAADKNLLRSEVSAMIYRLVKQSGQLGSFAYDETATPVFDDIEGEWFRSAIEYINSKGAFPEASRIYPNSNVTRGEAFKIICLGLNFTDDTDLETDAYAMLLYDAGFIQGDENGNLNMNKLITRAEFCAIYNRIIGRSDAKLETADGVKITADTYGFADLDKNEWYYNDMLRATSAYDENGYVDLELRSHRNYLDDYNPTQHYEPEDDDNFIQEYYFE